MSDNFGFKIGVECEKDFKNSLKDINQSFKVLDSEMNLVSSQFDKQDKSVRQTQKWERIYRPFLQVKKGRNSDRD